MYKTRSFSEPVCQQIVINHDTVKQRVKKTKPFRGAPRRKKVHDRSRQMSSKPSSETKAGKHQTHHQRQWPTIIFRGFLSFSFFFFFEKSWVHGTIQIKNKIC